MKQYLSALLLLLFPLAVPAFSLYARQTDTIPHHDPHTPQGILPVRDGRTLQQGYRGSVVLETGILPQDRCQKFTLGISTTHGYQFSPLLFLGAGVGLRTYHDSSELFGMDSSSNETGFPVYLALCATPLRKWVTPMIDLRAGYAFGDPACVYCHPTLGVRFGFRRGFGLNCGIGYTVFESDKYNFVSFRFGFEF